MVRSQIVRPNGRGCSISIGAAPGANLTEITGINQWRGELLVRIAAEPKDGRANEELVRFLADMFQISEASVVIVKGEKSSHKTVFLPVSPEKAKTVLRVD